MTTDGTEAPVLTVSGMSAGYGDETVLEKINLVLNRRDFVGLIGPNGGGKTTLLKVLLGLVQPTAGEVRINGLAPGPACDQIGYVPQAVDADRRFPIGVKDVVIMGCLATRGLFHAYTREDREAVDRMLDELELQDVRDRRFGDLSGGQQQRVLIARALVADPQILLLDEPTASVDIKVRENVYDLLSRLNERMTILLVTHDMGVISSYVKTVGCLNRELHYHGKKEITTQMLEDAYHCPVDLIAHGIPHRVLSDHDHAH